LKTIKAYLQSDEFKIRAQVVDSDYVHHNAEVFVYSTPITLYSGVNNPIKIQALNSDQKRIDVSNIAVQFGLFECNSENELISITASNVDAANGVVEATLTPSLLAPLDFGYYEIALIGTDLNSNVYPIYIDDNYGSRLTATLKKGPVLAYGDPLPVNFFDTVGVGVVSSEIDLTHRPQNSTLVTLQANLNSYTGNIIAQGSLISGPSSTDWGNISSTLYSNVSEPVFQNVNGAYACIRFILDSADPNGNGTVFANSFVSNANIRI
jgi:hypothetical protein